MTDDVTCIECGKDLTDPKNRGDPGVDGNWVCADAICRVAHEVEMTCDQVVRSLRLEGDADA